MKSQVAVTACNNYNLDDVYSSMREALQLLGGLESMIKKGDRVLLKLNLIGAWAPEKAVTTHPVVAEALGILVKEAGGIPLLGDSSGGSTYGLTEQALEVCGINAVARRIGAEIVNFDKSKVVTLTEKDGLKMFDRLSIAEPIFAADFVISVPKLKTHSSTIITGATKNMFGAIPGPRKAEIHSRFSDLDEFNKAIVEIYSATKPNLAIMDGIVGMEGNGPSAGNPKKIGLILAARDCIALDRVVCDLCGIEEKEVGLFRSARLEKTGVTDIESIEMLGLPREKALVKGFKAPMTMGLMDWKWLPKWIKEYYKRSLNLATAPKPKLEKGKCSSCGLCVDSCPVNAMEMVNSSPIIRMKECVSCFCCHELCPESAFSIKISLFWKFFRL